MLEIQGEGDPRVKARRTRLRHPSPHMGKEPQCCLMPWESTGQNSDSSCPLQPRVSETAQMSEAALASAVCSQARWLPCQPGLSAGSPCTFCLCPWPKPLSAEASSSLLLRHECESFQGLLCPSASFLATPAPDGGPHSTSCVCCVPAGCISRPPRTPTPSQPGEVGHIVGLSDGNLSGQGAPT